MAMLDPYDGEDMRIIVFTVTAALAAVTTKTHIVHL